MNIELKKFLYKELKNLFDNLNEYVCDSNVNVFSEIEDTTNNSKYMGLADSFYKDARNGDLLAVCVDIRVRGSGYYINADAVIGESGEIIVEMYENELELKEVTQTSLALWLKDFEVFLTENKNLIKDTALKLDE